VENRVSFYAGWNPAAREPPKRRHFATIIKVAETRPSQPCEASITQQKKRRVPREARLRLPWSVWADAHDLEVEVEVEVEFKKPVSVATPPFPVTFIFQK
jgi:hypothetical protein